jgi:hypothetical protein
LNSIVWEGVCLLPELQAVRSKTREKTKQEAEKGFISKREKASERWLNDWT